MRIWDNAQQKHRKDDDVKQARWGPPKSACSTVEIHGVVVVPFVKAGSKATPVKDLRNQVLRNQIVIRSAPYVGRFLTITGASMLGYSMTMPTQRVVVYSLLTRKTAMTTMSKDPFDGKWKTTYQMSQEAAKRGGYTVIYRKTGLGQHAKFAAKNPPIGVKTTITDPGKVGRKVATRTTGATMIGVGRAVPILAYGYVGYNVLKGESLSNEPNLYGIPITERGITTMVNDVSSLQIVPDKSSRTEASEKSRLAGIALRTGITLGLGMLS